VIPDLALSRGEAAHAHAREIGDRALEFLAAGGTAMAHLDMGEVERARPWIERAAAIASDHPTPLRAQRLACWRGIAGSTAGDRMAMRRHLVRATELAAESGRPAARCETLARLALEAARLGAETGDEDLLDLADTAATEAAELAATLTGHPPWGAQAAAARARVAHARGRDDEALAHARAAVAALQAARHEDADLDVVLPVADVLQALEAPEWPELVPFLQVTLAMIAQRTMDDDVRVRWLRGPNGRELTRLAGPVQLAPAPDGEQPSDADTALLRSLIQGKTNAELAEELGTDEASVAVRLGELFARIGVSSRAEATALAFQQRVL
jgi:DNA-binding CsgD family transcriptional regulator